MKTVEKMSFQGDLMFLRVDALPEEVTKSESKVLAHSENGGHHVAELAEVFTTADARTLFMRAVTDEGIRIKHLRPFDTHEEQCLLGEKGTTWMVRRAREAVPEGWRIVQD